MGLPLLSVMHEFSCSLDRDKEKAESKLTLTSFVFENSKSREKTLEGIVTHWDRPAAHRV